MRRFLPLLIGLACLAIAASTPAQAHPEKAIGVVVDSPFRMAEFKRPVFPDRVFDIRDFGAKEGGESLCTAAINRAITACHEAGGGVVQAPPGKWLTGVIRLKSNVNLRLETGTELHFSDDPSNYLPVVFTRWAGFEVQNYSPLIYAQDCENIAITGPGKLFGHGERWWKWKGSSEAALTIYNDYILRHIEPSARVFGRPEDGLRPQFIGPINCNRVLFEGFSIETPGPFWTMHVTYCSGVIIRDLRINSIGGPNTDGINIDSSRDVLIEDCHIRSGDDCVAIKSGVNEDGRRVARATENVVVRRCRAFEGHGGFTIGSEMSGGVRNVLVEDCAFDGTDVGLRMKSNNSRGGVVENITCRRIKMSNIKQEAFQINTTYGAYLPDKAGDSPPLFRGIRFEDVSCVGAAIALNMAGSREQPLLGITLKHVSVRAGTGMRFDWVDGLVLEDIEVDVSSGPAITRSNCRNTVLDEKVEGDL